VEVKNSLPADAFVMVAAVADWKTKEFSKSKIKKNADKELVLKLIKNPDILEYVSKLRKDRPKLVVGFAAETEDLIANATEKLNRKKCDWIVANDIRPETNIMGGTENAVILISNAGVEKWNRMDKSEVARKLVNLMAEKLNLS
jgi:phosphopantothenoylcysteine decarboxylase/phosphopantothenate--cysteine ligase